MIGVRSAGREGIARNQPVVVWGPAAGEHARAVAKSKRRRRVGEMQKGRLGHIGFGGRCSTSKVASAAAPGRRGILENQKWGNTRFEAF